MTVVQADITDVKVDAIVHPTNNSFYLGGEVGSAISRKGGQKVRDIVHNLHLTSGNLAVGSGILFLFRRIYILGLIKKIIG